MLKFAELPIKPLSTSILMSLKLKSKYQTWTSGPRSDSRSTAKHFALLLSTLQWIFDVEFFCGTVHQTIICFHLYMSIIFNQNSYQIWTSFQQNDKRSDRRPYIYIYMGRKIIQHHILLCSQISSFFRDHLKKTVHIYSSASKKKAFHAIFACFITLWRQYDRLKTNPKCGIFKTSGNAPFLSGLTTQHLIFLRRPFTSSLILYSNRLYPPAPLVTCLLQGIS